MFSIKNINQFAGWPVMSRSIFENHVAFDGNGMSIYGNHCHGRGARCSVYGNHVHIRDADGSSIYGNHCHVYCSDPTSIKIFGSFVYVNDILTVPTHGKDHGGSVVHGSYVNNSGIRLSGRTVFNGSIIASGGRRHDRERDRGTRAAPGGIAATHVVDCATTTGEVSAAVRARLVRILERITTPAAASSSSSSAAAAASPPPLPAMPPDSHKCMKASDDEKACIVCMENRVDALLLPCSCANTCVECAKRVKTETKSCPTCRKAIETVVVAHIGGVDA